MGNYGGFETFVSEIAPRLRERGFDVSCASRLPAQGAPVEEYMGVKISYFPFRFPRGSRAGRLFEILYDWYFGMRSSFAERVDVIYCLGIAPGLIFPLFRLPGTKLVVNIDGVEWRRAKFGFAERSYIRISYMGAFLGANRVLLDNAKLVDYIPEWVRRKAVIIPYGATPRPKLEWSSEAIARSGLSELEELRPHEYWLVVARLEPENSIHQIVEGYTRAKTSAPLVVIGDFSTDSYRRRVEALVPDSEGKRILLVGSVYNKELLDMLRVNCLGYIHGHTVGGTNPSLLEAMACGNLIVAHDNEFNREVARDGALYFGDAESLALLLDGRRDDLSGSERLRGIARKRSEEAYSWDVVVDAYASLFAEMR